ncbi:MAG: hypothetical protein ACLFP1_00995 [Candidatus Goldiibacteriota bacterium]
MKRADMKKSTPLTAGILFAFYFFGPPADLLYKFSNLAAFAVIVLVYLSMGFKIMNVLGIKYEKMAAYPAAFGFSFCVSGTLVFFAGAAGFYNFFYSLFFSAAVLFFCKKELFAVLKDMGRIFCCFDIYGKTAGEKISAGLLLVPGIYAALCILVPETYYDALVYHLGIPFQYIQSGGIINPESNIFSGFPQLASMNYLFVMLFSYELAVKLFNLFAAGMTVMITAAVCRRAGGSIRVSILAAVTSVLFVLNASRAGTELFLALLAGLFIYNLMSSYRYKQNLYAGCFFAGAAFAVKYTGVILYGFAAAAALFYVLKGKIRISRALAAVFIPLVMILPYLVKNMIYTDSAFYPFFSESKTASEYISHVKGYGGKKNIQSYLFSPFKAVSLKNYFGGDAVSPLFIIVFFMLLLVRRRDAYILAGFILGYYTVWYFTGSVLRFLTPLLPAVFTGAGVVFRRFEGKTAAAVLGAVVLYQAHLMFHFGEKYLEPFSFMTKHRARYISEKVSYYDAAVFINSLKKTGKILLMGEARSYYTAKPLIAYTVFDDKKIFSGFNEKDFSEKLKDKGITHILVNLAELDRLKNAGYSGLYKLSQDPAFQKFMDKHGKRIYSDGKCMVFEFGYKK